MKKTIINISLIAVFGFMLMLAVQCTKKAATVEDAVKNYYSSINKNKYKSSNPDMISGWAEKNDMDKQYLEEFQGTISEIFKQHQGLKEVKIVSTIPGSSEAEVTLNIELVCNDGYTEAVSHKLIKEGEDWKVAQ